MMKQTVIFLKCESNFFNFRILHNREKLFNLDLFTQRINQKAVVAIINLYQAKVKAVAISVSIKLKVNSDLICRKEMFNGGMEIVFLLNVAYAHGFAWINDNKA